MKFIVFMSAFLTISLAASIPDDAKARIDNYDNTNDGSGNYKFSFRTSNGIARSETSELVNVGQAGEHIVVRGVYSYTGPDGILVEVQYIADENGFQIVEPPQIKPGSGVAVGQGQYTPNVVATLLG